MNNRNLPPIPVYVWDHFLYDCESSNRNKTSGHLISVRARQNQALQFTILLDNGALFTGLPAHAITFTESTLNDIRPLPDCQMWDCISDDIDVFTMESLRYADCEVKAGELGFVSGQYLFTIDFVGEGYSRHPTHWKQLHAVQTNAGYFLLYPQYRIRFIDKALLEDKKELPRYKANTRHWIVGS
jgi:hypothetical protein